MLTRVEKYANTEEGYNTHLAPPREKPSKNSKALDKPLLAEVTEGTNEGPTVLHLVADPGLYKGTSRTDLNLENVSFLP